MRNLIDTEMIDQEGSTPSGRLPVHAVAFTMLGVAVAFALVALPAPKRDYGALAVAGIVGVALIAFSFCWRRWPRLTLLGVPLGFMVLATMLRASDGGTASGFSGLYFLSIIWLALFCGRRELVLGLIALTLVEVIPVLTVGSPEYPPSAWRPIVILVSVSALVGFTIQKLIAETRARALEATRWSQRLESLNEVGNALATETELQPLLDLVAERLRELVGARLVAVLLPASTAQLRFAAVSGALGPGEVPVDDDLESRLQARTSLWVPLVARDRTIGAIVAHDKVVAPDARFSDDDLRLAETFASRAAVAVDLSQRVARDAVQRVVAAQEVERQRLARELHDETGQRLTSVTLGLKSVEQRIDDPELREAVAALGRQVAATMQDVRRIALELRPKVLDDYGLVSALERLASTFSTATGIPVDVEAQLGDERLPTELETALYRIVQEGLTNVAKHAEPSRASVLLTPKNGSVLLVLEDDGRGFDATNGKRAGLGLEGMRERVELLEGRLTIESSEDAGTTLVVEVPVR